MPSALVILGEKSTCIDEARQNTKPTNKTKEKPCFYLIGNLLVRKIKSSFHLLNFSRLS